MADPPPVASDATRRESVQAGDPGRAAHQRHCQRGIAGPPCACVFAAILLMNARYILYGVALHFWLQMGRLPEVAGLALGSWS